MFKRNYMFNVFVISYDFLFFILYRFWETSPFARNSEDRAVVFLSLILALLCVSINLQIIHVFSLAFTIEKLIWPVLVAFIILWFNQHYFLRNHVWLKRIEKFKALSRRKNILYTVLVGLFIIVVLANLFYAYQLIKIQ